MIIIFITNHIILTVVYEGLMELILMKKCPVKKNSIIPRLSYVNNHLKLPVQHYHRGPIRRSPYRRMLPVTVAVRALSWPATIRWIPIRHHRRVRTFSSRILHLCQSIVTLKIMNIIVDRIRPASASWAVIQFAEIEKEQTHPFYHLVALHLIR